MDKIHVSALYNRIDVFIHDIDVSITDVHVPIIDVDVSISSIDVDVGCCDIRLLSLSQMSMFPSSDNQYRVPCMHEQGPRGVSCHTRAFCPRPPKMAT